MRKKVLIFDDTEISTFQNMLYRPFATKIITPVSFKKDYGRKHIRFNGFMEMAYTHPNYFKPDPSILKELGIKKGQPYSILRFVSWKAGHDLRAKGFTLNQKIYLLNLLKEYGPVFISSESDLPPPLGKYKINLHPAKFHDLLFYCSLLVSEGGKTAVEASLLGSQAIHFVCVNSKFGTKSAKDIHGTFDELCNKYHLVLSFKRFENVKNCIPRLLFKSGNNKNNLKKLLKDKISTTDYMIDLVENLYGKK